LLRGVAFLSRAVCVLFREARLLIEISKDAFISALFADDIRCIEG
jgi:hypothetical protein